MGDASLLGILSLQPTMGGMRSTVELPQSQVQLCFLSMHSIWKKVQKEQNSHMSALLAYLSCWDQPETRNAASFQKEERTGSQVAQP